MHSNALWNPCRRTYPLLQVDLWDCAGMHCVKLQHSTDNSRRSIDKSMEEIDTKTWSRRLTLLRNKWLSMQTVGAVDRDLTAKRKICTNVVLCGFWLRHILTTTFTRVLEAVYAYWRKWDTCSVCDFEADSRFSGVTCMNSAAANTQHSLSLSSSDLTTVSWTGK